MALIRVPQHRPEDLAAWERLEREDAAWATLPEFRARVRDALREILAFAAARPCYASTSWGKDSMVISHLVWTLREEEGLDIPLVWVRVDPVSNPHCPAVRDAFLARWPMSYREFRAECLFDEGGHRLPSVGPREVTPELIREMGRRWIGGLRGEESGLRARRMELGLSLWSSCQPLGHWTDRDVFAYLYAHDLPIHPAYAMSFGGSLDRGRLRVGTIGGSHGTGFGRDEWERVYYGPTSLDPR